MDDPKLRKKHIASKKQKTKENMYSSKHVRIQTDIKCKIESTENKQNTLLSHKINRRT